MACRCAPALLQLRKEFDTRWPGRDKASDGCCASAAHHQQNSKSDHEPDVNGIAHAIDIDEDLVAGMGDRQLWEFTVVVLADPRTKYVIYERQIMYPDGTVNAYHGINAHEHHMHVSIKWNAHPDVSEWLRHAPITPGPPALMPPLEDDDMAVLIHVKAAAKTATAPAIAEEWWVSDFVQKRGVGDIPEVNRLQTAGLRTVDMVKSDADHIPLAR